MQTERAGGEGEVGSQTEERSANEAAKMPEEKQNPNMKQSQIKDQKGNWVSLRETGEIGPRSQGKNLLSSWLLY